MFLRLILVTTTTSSKTTSFTKLTNTTFDGRRKDLQNADSENSATYLSIILPIFAILIVLGVVGAVLYWRRFVSCYSLKLLNRIASPSREGVCRKI